MKNPIVRLAITATRCLPVLPGSKLIASALARWILRRRRDEISASVYGYRTQLDPHEAVERELLFWPHLFDWRELGFLRREVGKGDVFLDLGSNVGGYSLAMSRSVGLDGLVLAVDADPYSTAKLSATAKDNAIRQLRVANVGLSDVTGDLMFSPQLRGNRGGGSFLAKEATTGFSVKCVTLSQLLEQFQISRPIKAMKMDLEGFEYRVLKDFFSHRATEVWPEIILVERSEAMIGIAGGDVCVLLASRGFRCVLRHGENSVWRR